MSRNPLPLGAGLAVGLLWLAASFPLHAQGTFRYVPNVNLVFPRGPDVSWDVDGLNGVDFVFQNNGRSLTIFPQLGSQILGFESPPPNIGADVVPLMIPSEIGNYDYAPAAWVGSVDDLGFPGMGFFNSCSTIGCAGTFVGVRAYFGFGFEINGQTHYGWALFNASSGGPGGILEEYAYNLNPGAPIFVGQVPEPGVVVLLTIGGVLFGGRIFRPKTSYS